MPCLNLSSPAISKIAILIKEASLKKSPILEYYLDPLSQMGVNTDCIEAYSLPYPSAKVTVKQARSHLAAMLPDLVGDGIELLYVADAEYFKQLTGKAKAEIHIGYVLPCVIEGYQHLNVILGSSYASLFHNPAGQAKIDQSLSTLASFVNGHYLPPGSDLFSNLVLYPDLNQIKEGLDNLLLCPQLTCDIETLSLHFRDAGICTISFAVDINHPVAFAVDTHGGLGQPVRDTLKAFFINYKGTIIWHNIGYDAKVIIYNLWMKHPLDLKGMREGIEIMTRKFDDTRLIAYLALNSCARVSYSLKTLAQEFAGNYAEANIENIQLIEPEQLLKYNCVDTMATWYVFHKYHQKMIDDQQEELYEGLFKDSVALLLEIELTGMPISMDKVLIAEKELETIQNKYLDILKASKIIQDFNYVVQEKACADKNAKLKVKRVTVFDFAHIEFNPNSNQQLQNLLYEVLQLPVIDKTKKKQPATGNKTLSKLKKHTIDPSVLSVLDALIELSKVAKILTAFIPTFKEAWLKADGCHYLHGNFNLGFVVSGRLSCSKPNLQQLPSGSTYGKLIKDCFIAPPGFIMAGADFASLEDKINALLTRDTNKLKVYTDGYDGHALRTYAYFKNQLIGIQNTVESINTMAEKSSPYYDLRTKSKAPTFALTFLGTYITLMRNCGFTEQEAKSIESNYLELYKESVAWVQARLKQASIDGYATAAFGLRIRCPLLKQVIYGGNSVPFEAQAEARTLGNAISGQSYGLLNNRASVGLRKRVLASPYPESVRFISLIHDAGYILIEDNIDRVHWANENYIECMQWQDLPELRHPSIKLGGDLELYYPSWAHAYTLPNHATKKEIRLITSKPIKK